MKKQLAYSLRKIYSQRQRSPWASFLHNLFIKRLLNELPTGSKQDFFLKTRIQILSPSDLVDDLYAQIQGGDFWAKHELIKAFGRLGYVATDKAPDVLIHLFGSPIKKLPNAPIKIIWIYSQPELVSARVLKCYDHIFCLSSILQQKIKQMGFKSQLLVAATSKVPLRREHKYDIVFVGNRTAHNSGTRKVVEYLEQATYNLKIWGRGWQGVIDDKHYAGSYFDNQRLNELYASSTITLADHSVTMNQYGFVSIRIFDILASGGFCLSDKNAGLRTIFGDSIPQYKNAQQLKELIDFYLANPIKREALRQKGQKIALRHTWDKVATRFLEVIN